VFAVRTTPAHAVASSLLATLLAGCGLGVEFTADPVAGAPSTDAVSGATSTPAVATSAPEPSETTTTTPGPPSSKRRLRPLETIYGDISPKSVVSSGDGLFLAQNMMYRHTVTAYDRDGELLATIPDQVDLSSFGFDQYPGGHQGAPVEAAFSPSGDYAYVSNYSMYGPGFTHEGMDTCAPGDGTDRSFVYRIDTETLEIDDAIRVGAVPKYVATSPDGRWVLVTNWCTYDLSVIDVEKGKEVRRIDLGPYPRGIAVESDSSTAYVAIMGGSSIAAIDLSTFDVDSIDGVGWGPRDLRISPDDEFLYVTLNSEAAVAKIDLRSREVERRASVGDAPRSMAISDDGTALYTVNYNSDTVSKISTRTMKVVQTVETELRPIGITYDAESRQLWVSCYSGSIMRFEDANS
jgi:YVTN family beta-propeller protein